MRGPPSNRTVGDNRTAVTRKTNPLIRDYFNSSFYYVIILYDVAVSIEQLGALRVKQEKLLAYEWGLFKLSDTFRSSTLNLA